MFLGEPGKYWTDTQGRFTLNSSLSLIFLHKLVPQGKIIPPMRCRNLEVIISQPEKILKMTNPEARKIKRLVSHHIFSDSLSLVNTLQEGNKRVKKRDAPSSSFFYFLCPSCSFRFDSYSFLFIICPFHLNPLSP